MQRLLATQFPQWANLPIVPAEPQGWDNRTFRLGADLAVRLPSAEAYRAQVDKEQGWLPFLAAQLPLPIPVPRARGAPGLGYPFSWSVHGWLAGAPAVTTRLKKPNDVARSLARFLVALQQVDPQRRPTARAALLLAGRISHDVRQRDAPHHRRPGRSR